MRVPVHTMLAATAERQDRIEPEPAGHRHRPDAENDAHRRPDVGQQVVRVGLERDRVVGLRRAQQHQRHAEIDERRHDRDGQADADLLEWLRRQQALHGGDRDAHRGDQDQRAFDAAREVLRLAVPVRVVLVRRARGDRQHAQRHDGADQVDDGFDRVREEPDRPGEQVRGRLQADRRDRGGNRQPGESAEVRGAHGPQDTRLGGRLSGRRPPARVTAVRSLTAAWRPSRRSATAPPRAS